MRVAIVGGGMAGLSAAHALVSGGAEAVVFEASDRPGGKVGSSCERGWLTEDGPHFLARPLEQLVDVAGLRDEVVRPRPPTTRWVHLRGRVLRAPSLPLLIEAGVPRALLEPLFARPLRQDMPLRAFLVERLGRKAGSLVASVMAAGVYAGDPDQLSARDAFPALGARAEKGSIFRGPGRERSGLWNLRRGLGSLPAALADRMQVRLKTPVERLEPGWRAQGEKFDAVVLALPASGAARLVSGFAPALAEALRQFTSAPVALVHLGFAGETVPRGFGVIDADAALTATGTLLPSSMLPGRAPEGKALVSAICGGALHPEVASLDDAELTGRVAGEVRRLLGVQGEPEYVRVVRHREAIPQYAPGHRDRVQAARAAAPEALELAGAAYDGVSVPDVVASGAAAARRLLRRSGVHI